VSSAPQPAIRPGFSLSELGLGIALLAALNLAWGFPVYLGQAYPASKDLVLSYQPSYTVLAAQGGPVLRVMEPQGGMGFPMLAESQSSQLYPPSLVARWLLDPDTGLFVLLYLHLFLSAAFMLVLCRELGLGLGPGLLAAVAWGGCSFLVNAMDVPSLYFETCWLPAVAVALARHLRTGRWTALWLGAAAFGCQLTAGHFQVAMFTVAFVVPLALCLARQRSARGWLASGLAPCLVVLALGLALAWAQVGATLDLLPEAARNVPEDPAWPSWPPYQIATLLQPFLFGIFPNHFLGGTFPASLQTYWGPGVYWLNVLYVGLAPLVLAVVGLLRPRHGLAGFLLLALLATLVWAMGELLPLHHLIETLPIVGQFRFPPRVFVLTCLCLALAAGLGLERVLRGEPDASGRLARRVLIGLASSLAALGLVWALAGPHFGAIATLNPLHPDNLRAACLAVALAAGLLVAARQRRWQAWVVGVVLSLTALDLTLFLDRHRLWAAPDFYRRLPAVASVLAPLADTGRWYSSARYYADPTDHQLDLLPPSYNLRSRLATVGFRGALLPRRLARYQEALESSYQEPDGTIRERPLNLDLFRLGNVCFFFRREEAIGPGLRQIAALGATRVHRIEGCLPRVRWAPAAEWVAGEEEAWAAVTAPGFLDRGTVVLEDSPSAEAGAGGPGAVRVLEQAPGQLVVRVDSERGGWLVVADTWLPNWQARVDDLPTQILRADHAFMAVGVTAGSHRVTFEYGEPSLAAGAVAALAVLALLPVCLMVDRRRRRAERAGRAGSP